MSIQSFKYMSLQNTDLDSVYLPAEYPQSTQSTIQQLKLQIEHQRERNSQLNVELIETQQRSLHLQCCLNLMLSSPKAMIPKVNSWSSLATAADFKPESEFAEEQKVGLYTSEIRQQKILKYKEKLRRYRDKVKISREFRGRSLAAKRKARDKGRFVKT